MTELELRNRITEHLRERKRTLPEIASEIEEAEEVLASVIRAMDMEGLIVREEDRYWVRRGSPVQATEGGEKQEEPTNTSVSAHVQNAAESEKQAVVAIQATADGSPESEEGADVDSPPPEQSANSTGRTNGLPQPGVQKEQEKLIKKFRLALKADGEAGESIFAAEKSKCVKKHRLGKVAIELKPFYKGEWGKFLVRERADHDEINRAMRIAKYLTEAQCEKLPILAAERLIKKIRDYHACHEGNQPNKKELVAMLEEALNEYKGGRRQQAKKAGESAVVDLVNPKVGNYYRHSDGKVYCITDIKEEKADQGYNLRAISAGGGLGNYPNGMGLTAKLASFCADVESEASQAEFVEQMAQWRNHIEKEIAEAITVGAFYSICGPNGRLLTRVDGVNKTKVWGTLPDSSVFERDLGQFAYEAVEENREKWDKAVAALTSKAAPPEQATTPSDTIERERQDPGVVEAAQESAISEGESRGSPESGTGAIEVAEEEDDVSKLEEFLTDFGYEEAVRWSDLFSEFDELITLTDAQVTAYDALLDACGRDRVLVAAISIKRLMESPQD